ncbi:MAG: FISUMP domain-containing protein [Bacteroidota bacterium]
MKNIWKANFIFLMLCVTACDWTPDRLPYADFDIDPEFPCIVPCEVTFINKSTFYDSLHWDWGDGRDTLVVGELASLVHTYKQTFPNGMEVTLTAYRDEKVDQITQEVVVNEPGIIIPNFSFEFLNENQFYPTTLRLKNESIWPQDDSLTFDWRIEDLENGQTIFSSIEANPLVLFDGGDRINGQYLVKLKVRSAISQFSPPEETQVIDIRLKASLTATCNSCYVDSTLRFLDGTQGVKDQYMIDWGEGIGWQSYKDFPETHVYESAGTYTIQYAVRGKGVLSDTIEEIVEIVDRNAAFSCGDIWYDSRDGKGYKTVFVTETGQCWFAENLRYGEPIDSIKIPTLGDDIPQFYWENYDSVNALKGGLYNFQEISLSGETPIINTPNPDPPTTGNRGICPLGWHIGSDTEWMDLERGLGMTESEIQLINGAPWRGEGINIRQKLISRLSIEPVTSFACFNDENTFDCLECTLGQFPPSIHFWTYTTESSNYMSCSGIFRRIDFGINPSPGIMRSHSDRNFYTACVRCVQD